MGKFGGRVVTGAVALAVLGFAGPARAADPGVTIGEDGRTAPVFDYTQAVRERVFIPQPGTDQDANGRMDFVTADIIRPKESGPAVKVPAIIDPSPYYTTVCRGNESQCMADWDGDGVNDRWPLFYDNYFVPRGYAYVLGQMLGTGYTTEGCPNHGGPEDIAGEKSIIDWLNGRAAAYKAPDVTSQQVVANWHNGSSAMIGKSYDGTLANGVAATGVEGLKTIVPVSAISAWYHYSRTGGVRHNTNYPGGSLNVTVTTGPENDQPPGVDLPNRRPLCAQLNAFVNTIDGDAHGDVNEFWWARDYVKDARKVDAAVFAVHGFQDDNVRMNHLGLWWDALKKNRVPRKLWLMRTGHTDPFEVRRAKWVETLHRWFDRYLHGVRNGIDREPRVTVEDEMDVWNEYRDWPVPGTSTVDVFLRGTSETAPGTLPWHPGGRGARTLSFVGSNSVGETAYITNPDGAQTNRRVFLSQPLKRDVRLSGTAQLELRASLSTEQSNLGVLVVDYSESPFTMVSRQGEGITQTDVRTCWGAASDGTRVHDRRELHGAAGDRGPCVLSRGRQAHPGRHAVARDARRPGLLEPRLAVVPARPAGEDRQGGPVPDRDDADRAHVQGRPPDRDHRDRASDRPDERGRGRAGRHQRVGGHRRREAQQDPAADRRRPLGGVQGGGLRAPVKR